MFPRTNSAPVAPKASSPRGPQKVGMRLFVIEGKSYTIPELARKTGQPAQRIYNRLNAGYSLLEALRPVGQLPKK